MAIGMCLGEKKRVTIPPELVSNATAPMVKAPPEDATLVYEIEMVKVDGFSIIEGTLSNVCGRGYRTLDT